MSGRVAATATCRRRPSTPSIEVVARVRDGRAALGIVDLPVPRDLHAVSLGWQEIVLLHPRDWTLDDPLDVGKLADVPLLSYNTGNWRHAALEDNLRAYGVDPTIVAHVTERDLFTGLVQQGLGAFFSYGRQAQTAVAAGAASVRLDPPPYPVREVGVVTLGLPDAAADTFIDIARSETEATLVPAGDPLLARADWIKGAEVVPIRPPPTAAPPPPPPASPPPV